MSQVDQIKALGAAMLEHSEVEINSEDKRSATMTVDRQVLVDAYESAGLTSEQVDGFIKTTSVAARALHFAATKKNIERVKEAVKNGEDYRGFSTTATCSYSRALSMDSKSTVEKRGETRLHGEPQKYVKYNYGQAHVDVSCGLPSETVSELAEEMKSIVKESKYYEGD